MAGIFVTCSSSVAKRTLSPSFTVLKKNFPPSKSAKEELVLRNQVMVRGGWIILVLVECPAGMLILGCHDHNCVEMDENIWKYLKPLTALDSWEMESTLAKIKSKYS